MRRRRGKPRGLIMDTVAAFGPVSPEAQKNLCWQGALESLGLLFQATCCLLSLPALEAGEQAGETIFLNPSWVRGSWLYCWHNSPFPSSRQASLAMFSVLWSATEAERMLSPAWVCCASYECTMLPMSVPCSP